MWLIKFVTYLKRFKKGYNELINSDEIDRILLKGEVEVRVKAKEKYEKMKKCIGLYR